MKTISRRTWWVALAVALACWLASPALAGTVYNASLGDPLIVVNESGAGTITFPGQAPTAMPGVLVDDPGPGGLHRALTYNLLGPPSLVAGDLLIGENDGSGDLIRFNSAGTGSDSYAASLVFYSAKEGSDLADTGLPHHQYDNSVTLRETDGMVTYTPNQGDPGYVSGYHVSYQFISDAPEPATWLLMISGGLLAFGWRKRTA